MGIQIAYISDRTNPFRAVRQSPKLASQAANVNINAPVIRNVLTLQNPLRQIPPMHDASAAKQENRKQFKLGGGEVDHLRIAATRPRASVQRHITITESATHEEKRPDSQ